MTSLLNTALNALEQVVLEVTDAKSCTVKLLEGGSTWASDLFPQSSDQQAFTINEDIPFLLDFLIDAKTIWQQQENAKLHSGLWTEITSNNKELHLEAIAIKHQQRNILVISNQLENFKIQQKTKQLAREVLLSYDRLFLKNEYLHTRLLSILNQPTDQSNVLATLAKVIENAEFAVLIASKDFTTSIENSAALSLFKQDDLLRSQSARPIDILITLMKNQLPEYQRILATGSSWDGELCWILPPSTLKWLKIGFYPVKSKNNQVESWIIFANDISTIKHLTQRNELLAMQDMLTELPNRFAFWQTLEEHIASKQAFYLLYIDINDFRRHNEFYGHHEGDKLLIELSKRIRRVIKAVDFIARVGGDEFAIILSGIDNKKACELAIKRIIENINKPFQTKELELFAIKVSIGVANYPNDAESVEELMKFVDLSAYNGKKNKKNSVQFYSKSMKDASHDLIKIEQELRQAIANNEFELYLQPIIDVKTNCINKAEALIRWNHPENGLISPDQFIPIAEKSGLIIALGQWVISRSCQIAKAINQLGYNVKISMNLSPSQVTDVNLFSHLRSCIKDNQLNPGLLELEVTEGVLVDDYAVAEKLLSKVRMIGMSVSVDDFGTGYSSLAYLKKLPLDYLKIDRSFIKEIVTDDNDKAIVRAVIAMAHNLNLCVTAEGVETKEQLTFLINNSCNSVQGYMLSRPIKLEHFIKLLNEQKTIN
ncbi:bifunctional diguanylate cyclase/phosphodiesterase [Colwellia sp. M166]|uniref:sensor domain-containing protein n=1 Tax=Colwellia sp. M166 TaxID=2583805 RepID=UPI00211E9ADA|nr:bifunctional diguanylate cyclase/phosphodiesterase [Colwellia sp. M166]UUO23334.1 bifunctional diguanylate cyclase/phosphodiesterase [Colwellia sp. M166]|tara:strand:+ start:26034 stop:28175 length:2142 start_codon:yes stop_codon:yes gene_type:complete